MIMGRRKTSYLTSSDLWIEVENGLQARLELFFDFVFAAFESVHRDVCIPPIFQLDLRLAYLLDLIRGKQAQAIHQCQVCHLTIVWQRR
jgi:hypothetical protein